MSRRVVLTLVAIVLGAAVSAAQQKPNFSGRWVAVSPASEAGRVQIVKHEGALLSTEHDSEGSGHRSEYTLDGKESRNVLTSHGQDIVTLSQAVWNGQKLTITSRTTYANGRRMEVIQTWSMDEKGQLVMDIARTGGGESPISMTIISARK